MCGQYLFGTNKSTSKKVLVREDIICHVSLFFFSKLVQIKEVQLREILFLMWEYLRSYHFQTWKALGMLLREHVSVLAGPVLGCLCSLSLFFDCCDSVCVFLF